MTAPPESVIITLPLPAARKSGLLTKSLQANTASRPLVTVLLNKDDEKEAVNLGLEPTDVLSLRDLFSSANTYFNGEIGNVARTGKAVEDIVGTALAFLRGVTYVGFGKGQSSRGPAWQQPNSTLAVIMRGKLDISLCEISSNPHQHRTVSIADNGVIAGGSQMYLVTTMICIWDTSAANTDSFADVEKVIFFSYLCSDLNKRIDTWDKFTESNTYKELAYTNTLDSLEDYQKVTGKRIKFIEKYSPIGFAELPFKRTSTTFTLVTSL